MFAPPKSTLCHYMIVKAVSEFVFFLLLYASSYSINRSTSLVTFKPPLNCHSSLGNRTMSIEKQEVIGDLSTDSRAEEGDIEAMTMPYNEQGRPKDWRAYAACFAGFCGMALCW